MTSTQILDLLKAAFREPMSFFWAGVGWLLDWLRGLGPIESGLLALVMVAAWSALAWFLQQRLRGRLDRAPSGPSDDRPHELSAGEIIRLELGHSLLVLPFKPFQLLGRAIRAAGRWLRGLLRRRKEREEDAAVDADQESPALVATLGPSFLLGGVATLGLYLLARLIEPLVAARLGLSHGLSVWQFLALGQRPELAWYLPLERFPYLAGLLAVVFWLGVGSLAATAVRAIYWRDLRRDLAWSAGGGRAQAPSEDETVLPFWRRWAGSTELWRPDDSYRRWALWPVVLAFPLLAWAWLSLGGDPYRIGPSEFAVAMVLWTSWALHLLLKGKAPKKPEAEERQERPVARPKGWEDVLQHLTQREHLKRPEPFERWCLAPPEPSSLSESGPGVISPLVAQLLPQNGLPGPRGPGHERRSQLTPMQREVLTTLALQGYVHSDPPRAPGLLTLGQEVPRTVEDRSGLRSRNLAVLAPEGTGKSTLALLAVTNHTLIHTRASLVVVADEGRAQTLARGFRRALEATPLRWSVRVRSPGDELMTDLSQGIVPDVVVTGLRDLVVTLLDRTDSFTPFLRKLGLLVIDDMEAFTGPREVHGQLAFRRLVHRIEELLGVEELGGRDLAAPQVLILGTDGMHEASEWAQSLCGIDAVTRRYPEAPQNGHRPLGREGVEHCLYRQRDFRTDTGELLSVETLIRACEAEQVPWHYRVCGDGRRDLGRGPLLLREEPRCYVENDEDAGVLLLEGSWSETRREVERLRRAGTRFARRRTDAVEEAGAPEPIGLVTMADPDLEMAFTQLDRGFALTPALAELPRPVFRPPTGQAVEPHLAADLTQHWSEVGDVIRIFGEETAGVLRALARQNLLQAEERTDVAPKVNDYERRVYVRALARAVKGAEEKEGPSSLTRALLPPRVAQVELVAPESTVAVRDRATLLSLARVDAASAPFVYYPGRIFRDARGAFVVVGRASDEVERRTGDDGGDDEAIRKDDVLAEPVLTDAVSSPRRQVAVSVLDRKRYEELREAAGGAFFGPDRVLLGREPIGLALDPVEIEVEHVATYRLGPVYGEVRERNVLQQERREREGGRLETVALRLLPNPKAEDQDQRSNRKKAPSKEGEAPVLDLAAARLLAAAMRAVLPSMYRQGAESVGVALQVKERSAAKGKRRQRKKAKKTTGESANEEIEIYLFDTDAGGNGTARAIYRDGVDLLLRLCRLVVERVLSLDRLLALYDEWGDDEEIRQEARHEAGGGKRVKEVAQERRKAHETLRHSLLAWLNSRLPPEGGAESQRDLARYFGSGDEEDEGDVIDLGRCWFSGDGSVTDLLWAKHRWQHPEVGEVMLDVGFDRETYLAARRRREGRDGALEDERQRYQESLNEETNKGDPVSPQPVFCRAKGDRPCSKGAIGERFEELHVLLRAVARQARRNPPSLAELAERLSRNPPVGPTTGGPASPIERVAAFVQGIPNFPGWPPPEESADLRSLLRAPVETLLARRGSSLSKALLLALLLDRLGHPVGLFVSSDRAQGGAFAGVESVVDRDLDLWVELASGRSGERRRLVPIDVTRTTTIGKIGERRAEAWATWAFLPLPGLRGRSEKGADVAPALPPGEEQPPEPQRAPQRRQSVTSETDDLSTESPDE